MKKTPLEDNHWITNQLSETEHTDRTVQTLAGRPDRKETIDRRRKSQSNDCRSGWGRVNHGAKDDSNSEHFFPTPNKLLTFFYHAQ